MNRQIQKMLQSLREAIHEALADSPGVASAMAELEREGHIPAFTVDVTLPEEKVADSGEVFVCAGPLPLTASDQDFLRNLGIETAD